MCCPRCAQGNPVEPELDTYVKSGADDRLLIVNIESTPAIQALDEILAVPGLDAVLIGPHDLTCNLGVPERYDHPDFLGACETIFLKARGRE
jgi:4-hydroxy-2-oxoheptanedioate aldolase